MVETTRPLVGIIIGSTSDWPTMQHTAELLAQFDVPHERRVVSAHRTPEWMVKYARDAELTVLADSPIEAAETAFAARRALLVRHADETWADATA